MLAPTVEEADQLPEGVSLLSFLAPSAHLPLVRRLVDLQVTAFSFELVPRISCAQAMGTLFPLSPQWPVIGRH